MFLKTKQTQKKSEAKNKTEMRDKWPKAGKNSYFLFGGSQGGGK